MPHRSPLQLTPVAGAVALPIHTREELRLTREASALGLFTDLRQTPPITVAPTTQIDRALNRMIDTGVRFLFVTDTDGRLVGSISSYDIAGEKPIRFLQARGGHFGSNARAEVLVRDIMHPVESWHVLDMSLARRATVGEIVDTFERTGQTHLVVVEMGHGEEPARLQGLFSATRIERALGAALDLSNTLHTFADIERAFEHDN
jgi:CBS domain-containing protein